MSNCINFYDGDIAGPGVRSSFYLQNFILVLLVDRSYEDAENALWTFIATSFGLTIAALVQVGGNNLSLLEGILVSQLTWLANIGTFLALASYSRSKGNDVYVKMAAVFQGYFSMVLTIVMWTQTHKFSPNESQSCLSELQFVWLFGWELRVLGSGRVVALVFASLAMVVYTAVTFTECRTWMKTGRSRIPMREHDIREAVNTTDRPQSGSAGSAHTVRHGRASGPGGRRRPPARIQWLGMDVDPIFFGILLSQVVVLTYFVSTTELIIRMNKANPTDKRLGFGQVLALTVVLPSLIALIRAMKHNSIRRLPREMREVDVRLSSSSGTEIVTEIACMEQMSRVQSGTSIIGQPRRPGPEISVSSSLSHPSLAYLRPPSSPNGTESFTANRLAPPPLDGGSSIFSVSTAN